MRKHKSVLYKKRKDAKELIGMIENLPEDKKREVLGIVRGYSLLMFDQILTELHHVLRLASVKPDVFDDVCEFFRT